MFIFPAVGKQTLLVLA